MSEALIDRVAGRPIGRRVMVATLVRALPRRFDPEAARDLDAVFELRVRGENGGEPDRYEIAVEDGRCAVRRSSEAPHDVTVTIGAADLVRLAGGAASWHRLLGAGRLELGGDPFLALRFPTLFRLSARARR